MSGHIIYLLNILYVLVIQYFDNLARQNPGTPTKFCIYNILYMCMAPLTSVDIDVVIYVTFSTSFSCRMLITIYVYIFPTCISRGPYLIQP